MRFDKRAHAESIADTDIPCNRLRIKQRTDEKNGVRAEQPRLVKLIFVHREVLVEHRQLRFRADIPKDTVRSEKARGFRQNGKTVRAARLIIAGDFGVREIL